MRNNKTWMTIMMVVLVASFKALAAEPVQSELDSFLEKARKNRSGGTVDELVKMTQLGHTAGRPNAVSALVRNYFSKQQEMDPRMLLLGAENAELTGDYRTAVTRYKQYLGTVKGGAESSDVAARLYRILVTYLRAEEEAFLFMSNTDGRFRGTVAARRYDTWFLKYATNDRNRYVPAAKWLSFVFADQSPVPFERQYFWQYLDWLIDLSAQASPDQYAALSYLRKLVPLVRDTERSRRLGFITANLALRAAMGGKVTINKALDTGMDTFGIEKEFGALFAAARALIDAQPTNETSGYIFWVLEIYFAAEPYNRLAIPAKQEFFAYVLSKLDDANRVKFLDQLGSVRHVVTPEKWCALAVKYPAAFRSSFGATAFPYAFSTNAATYKAIAPALQGIPCAGTALMISLGTSDDLFVCAQQMILRESWCQPAGQFSLNTLVSWFEGIPRTPDKALPPQYMEKTLQRIGAELVCKTPFALLSPEAARDYVYSAFRNPLAAELGDKSKVPEQLRLLDWVPFTEAQRKLVYGSVAGEIQAWAKGVRETLANEKKNPKPDAAKLAALTVQAQQIQPVEDALKQLMASPGDPAKGPDALCQNLARAVLAANQKNRDAYLTAARATYQLVKDYEAKKTPFGEAILQYLTYPGVKEFDLFDFHCEMLADQLVGYQPTSGGQRALNHIVSGLGNLSDYRPAKKNNALKLSSIFGSEIMKRLARNEYQSKLTEWFRATRRGAGWVDQESGAEVFEKLIALDQPTNGGWRPKAFSALEYAMIVRGEFSLSLMKKYPSESYFDDLFVAEIAKGTIDPSFLNFSRDEKKKVANALAKSIQEHAVIPDVYGRRSGYDYTVYPKLMAYALNAEEPIRNAMLLKLASYYGVGRYDEESIGNHILWTVGDVKTPDGRKKYFDTLRGYVERVAALPAMIATPIMGTLEELGPASGLAPAETDVFIQFLSRCSPMNMSPGVCSLIIEELIAKKRHQDLLRLASELWRVGRDSSIHMLPRLIKAVVTATDEGSPDISAAVCNMAMQMPGLINSMTDGDKNILSALRAKSLAGIGGLIAVNRSDPMYPLHMAQAEFQAGNFESAWINYKGQKEILATGFKDLDLKFVNWIIEKHIDEGAFDTANSLAQKVIQWVDSVAQSVELETKVQLYVVYADIAFAQKEYPKARAQYERIALSKDFEGTFHKQVAALRVAEVDRLTRNYDRASEQLEKLALKGDKDLKAESFYQLALIRFDQEQYPETREYIDKVFNVDPAHVNARILEGNLYLKMKKLVEATSVKIGLSAAQQTLVPGKQLKIELTDKNLAVVGKAASVEVRIWTKYGDEEMFSMMPFGDSKVKFEASVLTGLGAIQKGDRTLQVFGDDEIRYDFSERFKKANKIVATNTAVIHVISDAKLQASSGRILTDEERERREIARVIRAQQIRAKEEATGEKQKNVGGELLSTVRSEHEIKPGNPIHVRVTDFDMNVSTNRDAVTVNVSSTSGDIIEGLELLETTPYSGIFEGYIPTVSSPAIAFALDSEEGSIPSMAISGGDYKGWTGRPDNVRPKWFAVDLNENMALGPMTIMADVPGRGPKKMIIQTSMDRKAYTTVATWPVKLASWDGSPVAEVVKLAGQGELPGTLKDVKTYLSVGYAAFKDVEKASVQLDKTNLLWGISVANLATKLNLPASGRDSWYVAHIASAFWTDAREIHTFQVGAQGDKAGSECYMEVDGEAALLNRDTGVFEYKGALVKGAHRIDLYRCVQGVKAPNFEILHNIPVPPYMGKCPESMFTTANRPALKEAMAFTAPAVTTDSNGVFTVGFTNMAARVIRIWMADFESDAPAIRKLALKDSKGMDRLPAKDDLLKLRKNKQLEIVPGDGILLSYVDEKTLGKARQTREARLQATFRDAKMSANLIESVISGDVRTEVYIPVYRFKPGDALSVVIDDPDEDVSDKPDAIKFTVKATSGKEVTLEARETEENSGSFVAKIFPVTGVGTKPSEIAVAKGDDLILSYVDKYNTDHGVAWTRTYIVRQVTDAQPALRIYSGESRLLTTNELAAVQTDMHNLVDEVIPVTMTATLSRPEKAEAGAVATTLLDLPLVAEVTYPVFAQSSASKATLYVQTAAMRKSAGKKVSESVFDIRVAGTLKYEVGLSNVGQLAPPQGYRDVLIRGNLYAASPMEDGRFTFIIPTKLGSTTNDMPILAENEVPTLPVKGDDEVFFGFQYPSNGSNTQWLVSSVKFTSDSFFAVMDGRYREMVESAFLGDSLAFRVIDSMMDTTDQKNSVKVDIQTSGGIKQAVSLSETFPHSGIFKGKTRLSLRGAQTNAVTDSIPVALGETVKASYIRPSSTAAIQKTIRIHKGADGAVALFTKRFKDPEIAVQTQFSVAEAYFEMAKMHRELGQDVLSRREIAQGRKLFNEAIHDFPNTDARAHADYLLAELSLELGNEAVNEDEKRKHYSEAFVRFTDVVINYPDSIYSPKAQFKKGIVYERMGEIDKACEEYVKLSYRYPDNELVAETIARLGQYFNSKGKALTDKAAAEKSDVEKELLTRRSYEMYKTAAQVFGRLAMRFPDHVLAGKTTLLSAQCYIRANELPQAIVGFNKIIDEKKASPDVMAEALYWCGDTYLKLREDPLATRAGYRMLYRLSWDYPESSWAKFARGRLAGANMTEPE